jgi:hydroxymethylbilane synthase
MEAIRIGTRGSELALVQSRLVSASIQNHHPGLRTEICVIETSGDKDKRSSLSAGGREGFFTSELEHELQSGSIDLAVHSLKDLPVDLPEGLMIAGVLARHNPLDVLVSLNGDSLNSMKPGSRIATSSKSRTAQLIGLRSDINIVDIRGNVEERIQKMQNGYCDAMILAKAGLDRLGLDKYISKVFGIDEIIPSACQGIIAIETRSDSKLIPLLMDISDPESFAIATAEREFLRALQELGSEVGGCLIDPESDQIFGYNLLQGGLSFVRREARLNIFNSPDGRENSDSLSDDLIYAARNLAAELDRQSNLIFSNTNQR